jgi:hypothetical protein
MAQNDSRFMKTEFALRQLIIISQSADPAGAEACRYSENHLSFLRFLSLFAAQFCLECSRVFRTYFRLHRFGYASPNVRAITSNKLAAV